MLRLIRLSNITALFRHAKACPSGNAIHSRSNTLGSRTGDGDQHSCERRPILVMYTKENCSLCDEAKAQLERYKGLFMLEEIDITAPENKMWFDKYKNDIPVFHFNGKYLMRHKVHEGLLERRLRDYEKTRYYISYIYG